MARATVAAMRAQLRFYGWIFLLPRAVALDIAWGFSAGTRRRRAGSDSDFVGYRLVADGVPVEAEQAIGQDLFDGLSEGDVIPLRYIRTDPSLSEVQPLATESIRSLPGLLASVFGLLAIVRLLWRGRLSGSRIAELADPAGT